MDKRTDPGYINLASRIVFQAIKDWRTLCGRVGTWQIANGEMGEVTFTKIRQFFRSPWGEQLVGDASLCERILDKLEAEREEMNIDEDGVAIGPAPVKRCKVCGEIKVTYEFYRGRSDCKVCARKKQKEYQQTKKEMEVC